MEIQAHSRITTALKSNLANKLIHSISYYFARNCPAAIAMNLNHFQTPRAQQVSLNKLYFTDNVPIIQTLDLVFSLLVFTPSAFYSSYSPNR